MSGVEGHVALSIIAVIERAFFGSSRLGEFQVWRASVDEQLR